MDEAKIYERLGSIDAKLGILLKEDDDKEARLRVLETNQWKWMGAASVLGVIMSHIPFATALRRIVE